MVYNIDQPCTSSFPVGLVKTESEIVVRSVETGLRRWVLVVVVIVLMLNLFWPSQTWPVTLRIQEKVFSGCTVPPDSKETELGSSNQEASLSASKNNWVALVSCCAWKFVHTAISSGVDISEVPGCHLLQQMSSHWGSQKLLPGLVSHELTVYLSVFLPILNSMNYGHIIKRM